MKTIHIDYSRGAAVTAAGTLTTAPLLSYGEEPTWELHFVSVSDGAVSALDLSEVSVWRFAVDSDLNSDTSPMCRTLDSGIDRTAATTGVIKVSIDARSTRFRTVVNGKNSVSAYAELRGYDADAHLIFDCRWSVSARGCVDYDGVSAVTLPSDAITRTEALAILQGRAAASHAHAISDVTGLQTALNSKAAASHTHAAADITGGTAGKSAYELAVEGGYTGTLAQWLASLQGKSAYELAVSAGYTGTQAQYLASLKGDSGEGLFFDASGEVSDLSLYDDEEAGFKFAASSVDTANRKTTIYIYTKASSASGDWSDPFTVVWFGASGNAISVQEPVEFDFQCAGQSVYFYVTDFPHACVAQVEVLTDDGWLTLPYNSALGVKKILRGASDNKITVTLGSSVPAYTQGRIYVTQLVAVSALAEEATPTGSMYYGKLASSASFTALSALTAAQVTAGVTGSTVTKGDLTMLNHQGVSVSAGDFVFVLVPSGYTAKKDDGLGGKVAFETNNGAAGTGANGGTTVTIEGVSYKVYGEFCLAQGTIYLYTEEA